MPLTSGGLWGRVVRSWAPSLVFLGVQGWSGSRSSRQPCVPIPLPSHSPLIPSAAVTLSPAWPGQPVPGEPMACTAPLRVTTSAPATLQVSLCPSLPISSPQGWCTPCSLTIPSSGETRISGQQQPGLVTGNRAILSHPGVLTSGPRLGSCCHKRQPDTFRKVLQPAPLDLPARPPH